MRARDPGKGTIDQGVRSAALLLRPVDHGPIQRTNEVARNRLARVDASRNRFYPNSK